MVDSDDSWGLHADFVEPLLPDTYEQTTDHDGARLVYQAIAKVENEKMHHTPTTKWLLGLYRLRTQLLGCQKAINIYLNWAQYVELWNRVMVDANIGQPAPAPAPELNPANEPVPIPPVPPLEPFPEFLIPLPPEPREARTQEQVLDIILLVWPGLFELLRLTLLDTSVDANICRMGVEEELQSIFLSTTPKK
ncbi:hypothetical protein RHGRI_033030 [Rhododendron griersonianum]|uniref:Uncharacterized protein n=1 Tax=Rhododendron griersonianum TaxID=479676 RepID=A0AAV6HZD1_9ERIC|nr:hypothetical protein RHGRI_033030 [Rhododendron griersonianum]